MSGTDILIIGAGLSGSVIARHLAEQGKKVLIWERRNHIGGNMYDYIDGHGFLVHKYGPHAFHTNDPEQYDYIRRFEAWQDYRLLCGAVWDGKYTPTPFNFTTIDTFYSSAQAERLKDKLRHAFSNRETATVIEVLHHTDPDVRAYAEFLFQNDYAPYTAKQWGVTPKEIDSSVLQRVPLRFSYTEGYYDDVYQAVPVHSYTKFFQNILGHPNIRIELKVEALDHLKIQENKLYIDDVVATIPVVYTGALDELFGCIFGNLPYRSLRFEWKYSQADSVQPVAVIAYPKEADYTRITEYKKLPAQNGVGSSYAVEYPIPYQSEKRMEPYYPVLTEESQKQYAQYKKLADGVPNLIYCGRLADFKYYNMNQALERALNLCKGKM